MSNDDKRTPKTTVESTSQFSDGMWDEEYDKIVSQKKTHALDGKPLSSSPEVLPKKIGKYFIKKRLGAGAMGEVYLGEDPDLKREVAIKVVFNKLANQAHYYKRFLREAQIAAAINHPNLVSIYDFGTSENNEFRFIAMEYVDGGDLAEKLENEKILEWPAALDIIVGIAKALEAADERHIIHRDVKPKNIVLTKHGYPKLADLGIAKQNFPNTPISQSAELTLPGSTLGSPAYIAPEQIVSEEGVDIRADIYSLGVTFYQLVTGKLPFHGRDVNELVMKRIREKPPSPSKLNPDLPERLSRIILKMMATSREERYLNPSELLKDLERIKADKKCQDDLPETLRVSSESSGMDPEKERVDRENVNSPTNKNSRISWVAKVLSLGSGFLFIMIAMLVFWPKEGDIKHSTSELIIRKERPSNFEKIRQTRRMLSDLSARIRERSGQSDYWTSTPLVLTILPLDHKANPGPNPKIDRLWNEDLVLQLQALTGYPIVDRDSILELLTEVEIKVSELSDPGALFKLRKLLPASVLVKGSIRDVQDEWHTSIKLIDSQTSVIFTSMREVISDGNVYDQYLKGVALKIKDSINQQFPIQGIIQAGEKDRFHINIGRYHGIKKGMNLAIHKKINAEVNPFENIGKRVGTAQVERIQNFSSTINVIERTEEISIPMLVKEANE